MISNAEPAPQEREKVRQYFRAVLDGYKLPSLPLVVAKVIKLIRDGDVGIAMLARVIADDPALASRVLAMSRSGYFAQRTPPSSLLDAIKVIGFKNLRVIAVATAAQGLLLSDSKISKKLWSHSVAVALAARQIAFRVGYSAPEEAYLAGLLHDIGQMILLHGDRAGYEQMAKRLETEPAAWTAIESAAYELDHAGMGRSLLKAWDIGGDIGEAILSHHETPMLHWISLLPTIIEIADYLSAAAGFGFYATIDRPSDDIMQALGWADGAGLRSAIEDLTAEFGRENVLLMGN